MINCLAKIDSKQLLHTLFLAVYLPWIVFHGKWPRKKRLCHNSQTEKGNHQQVLQNLKGKEGEFNCVYL